MATAMRYTGPAGQHNHDVALATGEGDLLETGHVYEVPAALAERLGLSAHWERVVSFSKLTLPQLRELATERGVDVAANADKPALIASLRGENVHPEEGETA